MTMGKRGPLPPLPLSLAPPHLIPPAPTRDPRAIAFLPDLGGLTWVAYAAGPFLVVSHLPSPPRRSGDTAGDDSPFFRQVVDLRAPVSAVAWCGRGGGELAAAAANSVSIFQPAPAFSSGSFGWLLRWSITEDFAVAAVAWTGSGDGIVAVGAGISMWARAQSSWQLAWRSRLQVPESMVSTTRFLQGPVATVPAAALVENSVPVLVFLNDAKRRLEQAELVHPQPVCMIQWRPWPLCVTDQLDMRREILMTCCLDGTVRLWSENEVVRTKKQHGPQITFSVIAVIELNSTLNGVLGVDIAVRWPVETGGVVMRDEEGKFDLFSGDSGESQVGECEWLVSVGPGPNVNFWAIHCLDDISPPRYPRITPWKQSKLHGWEESNPPKSIEHSIFIEAVISRRLCSSPPTMCSLLHFLADDSFIWSRLFTNFSSDSGAVLTDSSKSISCCLTKTIEQDGHKGSIRQVAVHPYSCEIELAVSMDSSGMLCFWSLSTFSTLVPTLHASIYPLWKLLCKFDLCDLSADLQYSCLCWAPSFSHNYRFLVLGGENGVDCPIVRIQNEEVLSCHKIFTIPFLREINAGPLDSIHTIPVASNCSKDFVNNSFLVVCIWRKRFQAFSWKVDLHSKSQFDKERCSCGFSDNSLSSTFHGRHITCFSGEIFAAVIREGSSVFPIALEGEYPTCISVMSVNNTVLPMQQHGPSRTVPGYHIATGCSDGSVKLWKMSSADDPLQSEKESHSWELVGAFGAHQGPISAISLSSCGRIATVGRNVGKNSTSIHIWEAVKLTSDGAFLLEDALTFQGHIVGLDGTSLGDGRFLLAVYLPNKLHIYSPKHPSCQNVVRTENSKEKHLWSCIAFSNVHHDIASFLWGPKATIVLVHENHLALLSSWLVKRDDKYNTQLCASPIDAHEELPYSKLFNESTFGKCKLSENQGNNGYINSILLRNEHDNHCSNGLWNLLDIADELSGPLASYHPRALVQYLYSGEWKRANAALEHLVKLMKANETSKVMSECSSCSKTCRSILELPLSEYFTDTMSNSISNKGLLWGENRSNMAFNLLSPSNSFSYSGDNFGINTTTIGSQKPEIAQLLDMNFSICAISDIQRTQILAICDLMSVITDQSRSSPYKSLDEAGRRFWVAVQLRHLYAVRTSGDASSIEGCRVDSASIAWALQSDCPDDLLNSVLSAEPTWPEMQNLGIGLWYNNVAQLRTRMEKLARSQYLKRKDPKDCALLYIALNRINVLVGLFKISRDEKDKRLYEFLSRNFQEERHKAAALKNAYVLMGRHQWDLAIAFFLLGGDTSSAVSVCAKNLLDEQLAIVICRLVEGSGGPLERNLISSVLLPGAVEKGDHWLSSLLEWILGNYWLSINKLFGFHTKLLTNESKRQGDQNVFADPEVGQYCAILATKNSFRNCVGEVVSANLSKLSVAVAACALNKCGLPLEALECLSCNTCIDGKDSTSSLDFGNRKIFYGILGPFASSNWLSSSVVTDIELNLKVTMASKYLSRLLRNHSLCSVCNVSLSRDKVLNEYNSQQTEELERDVMAAMLIFDKRFSLKFTDIAEKMLIFCCYDGLLFLAYVLLWGGGSQNAGTDNRYLEGCTLRPIDYLLLASCKESCKFLSRYAVFWCLMCFVLNVNHTSGAACTPKYIHKYIIAGISNCMDTSRLLLKHDNGRVSILENKSTMLTVMSLLEYIVEFYLSWLCRDIKALLIKINPVLASSVNGESFQVLLDRLVQAIQHTSHGISSTAAGMPSSELYKRQPDKNENSTLSIDDKWHLIGISLWIRLSSIMKHYLREFVEKERLDHEAGGHDLEFKDLTTSIAAKFIVDSLHFVSSSLVKLYASLCRENLQKTSHSSVLFWLESKSHLPRSNSNNHDNLSRILQLAKSENLEVLFNILWETYANPVDVSTAFVNEEVNCFSINNINLTRSWKDVSSTVVECEKNTTQRRGGENKYVASSKNNEKGQGFADKASDTVETSLERTDLTAQKDFQTPKELLRRSGELLEAICFNSINEKQVAIATNRKGLLFFNWSDQQHNKKLPEYVWSGSDWPLDGWAGCESTPTPTFISSSAALGRRSHLGSGGATTGLGSLAKPGRDLTGGGAFGIPGYAGIGASGFGWGEPEEFEDFVDPPATLENIHSRALSRHPSLPLLLVGSSNTHVYLWEFGKESAMATYGVLHAANIPPPYALASISAVQFDYYGHRFATATLDGTVCTWQVEVGGRSNVNPTVSSLCFNTHASDVTYVATSGSVVAAAGCNSNGANVVIWDTLAPPATCLTSITCHEGGARSISVFDSDIGCGSISPLIVTGGKSGDVALHDFRFVSTGKSKNRRISTGHDIKASSVYDTKSGTSGASTDGMIWHVPKAHLGSVTKVSTIPNTSLFLTGSKDGDVKLWDAKNSQLVFHWPKLHERHTFFQPTSRGFGGVVRAAVTDIQVLSHGFISCGGDGSVKLVQVKNNLAAVHQR